jgi:AcrR family transcriptional regulator
MSATAELRRPPGRPRSVEADEAILEAAIEQFAVDGYEGLTVESVAARAGVSKATVYRRHPGKLELVIAACKACAEVGREPPDTGDLRGDLRALVDGVVAMLTTSPVGRALPMLVADRARIPELDTEQRALVAEKRSRHLEVVERAVRNGELRNDVDAELVVDACVGPVFYRFLVSRAALDQAFVDALVDSVARAFAPETP